MNVDHPGVYLPTSDPNTYESTPLASAGWYENGQHGGAVSALVVAHLEKTPTLTEMEISRVTVELHRVVPVVPLTITSRIVREGKKIQVVTAELTDPDGLLLAMATVQRLRVNDRPTPEQDRTAHDHTPPLEIPALDSNQWGIGEPGKVMFHRHAIEIREIYGSFSEPGPGAIWARIVKPIIAGEPVTPAQRAIAVADFPNGVSRELDKNWVFMNPDLTVHLMRYPQGEWAGLEAVSYYSDIGRGIATGTLFDEEGVVGRTTQTLFLDQPGK